MADFDEFAQSYRAVLDQSVALSGETSAYFADYKARYMAATALGGRVEKILDFGCGVGLLSSALKKHFPEAIQHGYDISPASIEKIDLDLVTSGRFTTDLLHLDDDYDAIVMAAVLHHIPLVKRRAVCGELASRLAVNGKLFVFEHNPANPITRWVVNQCPLDRDAILLKPGEVIAHLRNVGLRPIRRDYIVFFPRLLSRCRPIERFIGWCPFGAQYAVVATKDRQS